MSTSFFGRAHPNKYSGRAHPLETLLKKRAARAWELGNLLISFIFFGQANYTNATSGLT